MLHLLCVVSIWLFLTSVGRSLSAERCKVVIAGAGPAGLLTAQALLSRNEKYSVLLIESKSDPRYAPIGPRAYSLGLNIRGQSAFKYFEEKQRGAGMWDLISKEGVKSDSFFLHIGAQKFQIRKPAIQGSSDGPLDPPPTLLIQRNRLCTAMLTSLEKEHSLGGRLRIQFDKQLTDVSFATRQAILDDGEILDYDLLIGADGVQSCVRQAMLREPETERPFEAEEVVLPGQFKVMVQASPPSLESDAVHAMEGGKDAKFSLFCIPTIENRTCALVSWRTIKNGVKNEMPTFLREDAPLEEVKSAIADQFPKFGAPTDEAVLQLRSQRPSEAKTIRCNRYHHTTGRALILGDSAHSTGGTLVSTFSPIYLVTISLTEMYAWQGQGANSALRDVVALDQCLEECNDKLEIALSMFSARQVPEGLALWQLLQLPPKGPMGMIYQLLQVSLTFLSRIRWLRRWLPQATQTSLSQTLTPFSEIVRKVRQGQRITYNSFQCLNLLLVLF